MQKKYLIRLTTLTIFVAFIIWLNFAGLKKFVTFDFLKTKSAVLMDLVESNYFLSALGFTAVYFVAVAVSLPAAFLFTILGGFLFGTLLGTLYSVIGSTLGGFAAFAMVRYGLGEFIQDRYRDQLSSFNKAVDRYGASFLIVIHFVAVVPFFLINLLAGMTRISAWTFTWTTAIGIIPVSLVYAFAGSQLHDIQCVADVFSNKVILALILIAILAIVPIILGTLRMPWQKSEKNP